jgi:nucleoid-associated protein YgaU
MGIFDKMFGSEAKNAQTAPNAQARFEELKQKYQPALQAVEQQNIQLQNLHVQDNKLFIRGTAPSEQAKNAVWDRIKQVNPQYNDITADITVVPQSTQAAAAGGGTGGSSQGGQSYTVRAGDSLSKISQEFYGDAHEYMRIFYANRDKLTDPDKVQVGQVLVIPPQQT